MQLEDKIANLKKYISKSKRVAVAFSGGVDSTFLSKMVYDVLGNESIAFTILSMFIPEEEIRQAAESAEFIGIPHKTITIDPLDDKVLQNDRERCYQCKTALFKEMLTQARELGFDVLFDGSNIDDLSDFRPGLKALQELNIISPLIECEFTKNDIRQASKQLELPTWNIPSMACLASRIPYNQVITEEALKQVANSEAYLKSMGVKQVRVRHHQDLARIEIDATDRTFFFDTERLDEIAARLKSFGFKYVTFDLEGYQTGKLN